MKDTNVGRFEMREEDFFLVSKAQKFEEAQHPRDTAGKFTEVFHGSAAARVDSILKDGLKAQQAGGIWPEYSRKDNVYLTTAEDNAETWAVFAANKGKPTGVVATANPVAIFKVRIPDEHLSNLRRDENTRNPESPARQFKGDIPPEWIIGARIGTPRPMGGFEWTDVPVKKVAADGQIVYVVVVLDAEKQPGVGGITRKFDEAKHPRDKDGRFAEATAPRIFNRPSDVGESRSGWANDPVRWAWINKETGKPGGHLLTGEPISRDQIPPKLYHVTTDAPAVESSGVLLGQLGDTGLGGGQAQGVSFTSSKEDAIVIQRELRRAVRVARGEAGIEAIKEWAQQDELMAGLPEGALSEAVAYAMQGWDVNSKSSLGRTDPPNPPEEEERIRRSLVDDALKAYLQTREETAAKALGQKEWPYSVPILKNPLLFGQQKHLAKLDVKNIQILETAAEDIPTDALVTTGSDKFLHEVRVYADVPRRRKAAGDVVKWEESQHPRDEEGQFTRVAMTSQRPPGDPGHQPNKDVFHHMREFHERLSALPGVSSVSVKPGVGGWEGGSESMWQIYYKGNGEARKLVAQTAKAFNQDAVLILNKCGKGQDCQPAVELSFEGGVSATAREAVHEQLVAHGIGGWTWMKRDGKTILRMVSVPQWGGDAAKHRLATAAVSQRLQQDGLKNHRRVRKVAVSIMEREGAQSYDQIIAGN